MKIKSTTRILVAVLALFSICTITSKVQAKPPVGNSSNSDDSVPVVSTNAGTTFSCVPQSDGSIATVGQRPGGKPIPLFFWTQKSSSYFGGKYTPQNRCNIVTPKLNVAVAANGGSLKNILLSSGKVNRETVVCVISATESDCNSANVLFTLRPQNAQMANVILSQIMQISREGASAGVIIAPSMTRPVSSEGANGGVMPEMSPTRVNLGDWEELTMGDASSKPVNSEKPQVPDNGGGL
jgi:Circadian oscillating protein COP23